MEKSWIQFFNCTGTGDKLIKSCGKKQITTKKILSKMKPEDYSFSTYTKVS